MPRIDLKIVARNAESRVLQMRRGGPCCVAMEDEPIEVPITDELDLHAFRPGEVKELLGDYFEACLEKGIFEVRVIHGKGTGALRELVHAQLRKSPFVESFALCDGTGGSWGATRAKLRRPTS